MSNERIISDSKTLESFVRELTKDEKVRMAMKRLFKMYKVWQYDPTLSEAELLNEVIFRISKAVLTEHGSKTLKLRNYQSFVLYIARNFLHETHAKLKNQATRCSDRFDEYPGFNDCVYHKLSRESSEAICDRIDLKRFVEVATRIDPIGFERLNMFLFDDVGWNKQIPKGVKEDTFRRRMTRMKRNLMHGTRQFRHLLDTRRSTGESGENTGQNGPDGTPMPGTERIYFKIPFFRIFLTLEKGHRITHRQSPVEGRKVLQDGNVFRLAGGAAGFERKGSSMAIVRRTAFATQAQSENTRMAA